MHFGVNLIAPQTFPVLECLIKEGHAHFCEIMLDNFIHLEPQKLKTLLGDIPCAFHMVASRFLEKDEIALATLAERIRKWCDDLNPLYISDHLVRFRDDLNRNLPFIAEPDYARGEHILFERVHLWQSLLQRKLWLENHASMTKRGLLQPVFFAKLLDATGCGLLFDVSNAHIASCNIDVPYRAWNAMHSTTRHFHVAGFSRMQDAPLLIDTHDAPLAPVVLQHLQQSFKHRDMKDLTCVIEFDVAASKALWQQTLVQVKDVIRC